MIRFSVSNLVATATLTSSTADAAYPLNNFKFPTTPGMPFKWTVATDSWIVCDLGSAQAIAVGAVINANFTSFRVQGNAADSWGAPSYNQLLTVARGPNGRYQHAHRTTGSPSFRYWRFFVPTQATTDGATVFTVGGGWLGALLTPPHDLLYDGRSLWPEYPVIVEHPQHEGWEQESSMGRASMRLRGRRYAHQDTSYAFTEWQSWLDIERQWKANQAALVLVHDYITSHAWVMKMTSSPVWDLSLYSDAVLEAREYA